MLNSAVIIIIENDIYGINNLPLQGRFAVHNSSIKMVLLQLLDLIVTCSLLNYIYFFDFFIICTIPSEFFELLDDGAFERFIKAFNGYPFESTNSPMLQPEGDSVVVPGGVVPPTIPEGVVPPTIPGGVVPPTIPEGVIPPMAPPILGPGEDGILDGPTFPVPGSDYSALIGERAFYDFLFVLVIACFIFFMFHDLIDNGDDDDDDEKKKGGKGGSNTPTPMVG